MEELDKPILIDPSLAEGGNVIFDKETPFKFQDKESNIIDDAPFHFRIILYNKGEKLEKIRFEITMESDLYYFYISELDEPEYNKFKKETGLTCSFEEFPASVVTYMDFNEIKDPDYSVILAQVEDDRCELSFQQKLKIKMVDLFVLEFVPESEEFVNRQIQYRFDLARTNLKAAKTEREDLCKMMRVNDNSIIKNIPSGTATPKSPKAPSSPKAPMTPKTPK